VSAPEAILFDFDGVLIDSRAAITGCMNDALEAVGLPRHDPRELERFIGPPQLESFTELGGADLAKAIQVEYRRRYATKSLTETVLMPGMLDVVAELAMRSRLGIATSKPQAFAEPLVERLGLARHFEVVVGPDLDVDSEPKRVTVARALKAMGVSGPPLVGDRSHDVEAATANGMACVGVLWGIGSEAELREAGAAAIVSDPVELLGTFSSA
jgi:phosphoglycolate phosphatase